VKAFWVAGYLVGWFAVLYLFLTLMPIIAEVVSP